MPGGPNPPLSVIASWPPPNHVNPEGRGRVTSNIAFVLTPITFFIVFSRLWVRFYMQRNAGWDDWLMVVALVIYPLSHDASHSLTVWQPLVMALAILIPWSKIIYYFLLSLPLILHSCRQISQRRAYMGCRSNLIRDPKKAHLDHRGPIRPRHRACQSFHPSVLPSSRIARHLQSL